MSHMRIAVLGLLLLPAVQGCADRLTTVRTTLDVVKEATETGWGLANTAAADAERALVGEIAALPPEERPSRQEAQQALEGLRATWDARLRAFSAVREAHGVALVVFEAVEAGAAPWSELDEALDHLLGLFRELRALIREIRDE